MSNSLLPQNEAQLLLGEANTEHPALVPILSALWGRGKINYSGDSLAQSLLSWPVIQNRILSFQTSALRNWPVMTENDVALIETEDEEILFRASGQSAATLIAVTHLPVSELADHFVTPERWFQISQSAMKWLDRRSPNEELNFLQSKRKPALFLDRDGVIIRHIDFISEISQVELLSGITELVKAANLKGYLVVVVTNQSGLGREILTSVQYDSVTTQMLRLMAQQEAFVDRVLHSPYFDQSKSPFALTQKGLRKPRAGMILKAKAEMNIDLSRSIMVGDRATDLMAATMAGLGNAYLYHSSDVTAQLKLWREWPHRQRAVWGEKVSPLLDLHQVIL
jgi:D-glycero-D-manno-heptose 1,7-bisphosphate phosphatase